MGAGRPKRAQEVVAAGYDALGQRYGSWAAGIENDPRHRWLEELMSLLPDRAKVLDLGCGPGIAARVLAGQFDVVGVDISERQIAIARETVPDATFVASDMTRVEFGPRSFDAVVALYSLIHLPLIELGPMLARIAAWLRPGGLLLASLGTMAGEGIQDDWLGVPMFFAGNLPGTSRQLVAEAGFVPLRDEVLTIREPEGEISFHWLLSKRALPTDAIACS